ncbi:MAG TPA: WbqC family protein [Anditalea sp.]|nr:WbqC family protein [Anditalea sp.]
MSDSEIYDKSKIIAVDLLYLPPIEFFVAIGGYDTIVIEKQEHYQKQTYRNRASVLMANKVEDLSIPVRGGNKKIPYKDILIDEEQNWKKLHLRGIQSAYGKAPFFEYLFPDLESIINRHSGHLFDLNLDLLSLCLKFLRLSVNLEFSNEYVENLDIKDIRGIIHPKTPFERRYIYYPAKYMQLFGLDFVPNLSIIDLMFCEGPNASKIIAASDRKLLNNTR